jgi:triacylglycerol esterase/lipase EstA (alpha/beta hydrolase family)
MFKQTHLWHKVVTFNLSVALLFVLFSLAFIAPTTTTLAAYPEVQLTSTTASASSNPGTIYYGPVPNNASSKPVLLFVHGLNDSASAWFNNNDMFTYAYNAGFRAVGVDLQPGGSILSNGQLLSGQIQQILAHYHVTSLNVVAHSKGGLDTQAAVVFYGAGPYIQNEVTLDSPHHGSQLADLDYSWWSWWLGAILGQHSDATYDLQTSYMSYFRSITDNSANNSYVNLYTTAGTYHSWPLSYFFGGAYLSQYGPNDGAVTVDSSYNPNGEAIYSFNYNHSDVKLGHNSFNIIAPYISSFWRSSAVRRASPSQKPLVSSAILPQAKSDQILRGGTLQANHSHSEEILVETGVSSLDLELLTENSRLQAVAVGPRGERVNLQLQGADNSNGHYFKGAQQLTATLNSPAAGKWRIEFNTVGRNSTSYFLLATVNSSLKLDLTIGDGKQVIYAPGSDLALNLKGVDAQGQALRNLHVEGWALHNGDHAEIVNGNSVAVRTAGDKAATAIYKLPAKEGVYNLSLTVTGTTADGQNFERSLVTSVLVGSPISLATHAASLQGK